jgi:hypothetical protein
MLIIGMTACSEKQSHRGIIEVSLEFGQLDENGKLKFSDLQNIEYNFDDPTKSKSKKLKVGTAIHSASNKEVYTITQTGVGSTPSYPPHYRVISQPGHAFFPSLNCYVYGTVFTDTDTGASWFVAADAATQSTMNNCNYGDIV